MMSCKHYTEMLIGTRDGIKCACGAIFATWAELEAARKEPEEEPVKKPKRRKKTTE